MLKELMSEKYLTLKSRKNTIYWKCDRFDHTTISTLGTMAAILNYQVNNEPTDRNDCASDGRTNRKGWLLRPAGIREKNHVDTSCAAYCFGRRPQTMRVWASAENRFNYALRRVLIDPMICNDAPEVERMR